ncbi:MAG TPA: cyclic nucleotide-binding domain-containing protein [Bryobacteraceae bacterium]
MTPEEFIEIAHAYRVLADLEPSQLRKLLLIAEEKEFAAETIIIPERAKSSFLYLIVSGAVALERWLDHYTVLIQTLHAGDAMGWSALTSDARTHFQTRALTPVSTVAFAGDRLLAACDQDPRMGYALMKRLLELVTERLDRTRLQPANREQPQAVGASDR